MLACAEKEAVGVYCVGLTKNVDYCFFNTQYFSSMKYMLRNEVMLNLVQHLADPETSSG